MQKMSTKLKKIFIFALGLEKNGSAMRKGDIGV